MNEDFRRLNADRFNTPAAFQPIAGDPNFEFRLTCIDPNGNPTNGITRTFANRDQFFPMRNRNADGSINEQATGIKFTAQGGRDAWATDRYLNIWVCDMGDGVIGYGQFPDEYTVKPATDGVVMLFNAFGRVGNVRPGLDLGRVCDHEIGHWLNLRHIWGDGNCGNDFVDDTPVQQTGNRRCPGFPRVTCNNGPNGDMFMNYMDYTENGCQNIFTRGQNLRMRAIFAQGGPRAGFIDNYFRINQPTVPICNTGNVTATNPNCLPVTWSVVSGPATIIGGQGTNTVTLQSSGNGIAVLRATAGGYIDEENIIIGAPLAPTITTFEYDPCGTYVGAGTDAVFGAIRYIWNLDYIDYETPTEGLYLEQGVEPFPNFPLNAGQHFLRLKVENACGISGYSSSRIFTTRDCGAQILLLSVSPNPSNSTTEVTLSEKVDKTKKKDIYEIRIIDKMGNIKQTIKYGKGTQTVVLDFANFSFDIYTIQAFDGKSWFAAKFSKK